MKYPNFYHYDPNDDAQDEDEGEGYAPADEREQRVMERDFKMTLPLFKNAVYFFEDVTRIPII